MKNRNNYVPREPAPPLLLYSMGSFWPIVAPLLKEIRPARVCEIGLEKGGFTEHLLDFCDGNGIEYIGVDPSLSPAYLKENQKESRTFMVRKSLDVLGEIAGCGAYIIDGDHNYYTVSRELQFILAGSPKPLVILHDVSWPWARRDLYYDPTSIPPEHRHASTDEKGPVLSGPILQDWGFVGSKSDENFYASEKFGGEANGVLTAAEDTIASTGDPDWKILILPAIFGLGIIYHASSLPESAKQQVDQLENAASKLAPLLSLLEHNRLELFLNFLRMDEMIKEGNRIIQAVNHENAELRDHTRSLQEQNTQLQDHCQNLGDHCRSLAQHNKSLLEYSNELEKSRGPTA